MPAAADSLRVRDDFVRRVERLDRQAAARDAVGENCRKLAVVGGAEVEAARHEQDADRVQQLAVEQLDADDRVAARRDPLLDERGAVEPEVELGCRELVDAVERDDAGAAAADVRLDEDREAKLARRVARRRRGR